MNEAESEEARPAYAYSRAEVNFALGKFWGLIASPGRLFENSYHSIRIRGYSSHSEAVSLTRMTDFYRDREGSAEDQSFVHWLLRHLEQNPGFIALQKELARFGLKGGITSQDMANSAIMCWGVSVREEHLELLERAAQDAAGFVTLEQREKAAADFRIYISWYSSGGNNNQQELPKVDCSPYELPIEKEYNYRTAHLIGKGMYWESL